MTGRKCIMLAGMTHYANRWDDFVGAFDSYGDAVAYARELPSTPDWLQIIDTEDWKVVAEADRSYDRSGEWPMTGWPRTGWTWTLTP